MCEFEDHIINVHSYKNFKQYINYNYNVIKNM